MKECYVWILIDEQMSQSDREKSCKMLYGVLTGIYAKHAVTKKEHDFNRSLCGLQSKQLSINVIYYR